MNRIRLKMVIAAAAAAFLPVVSAFAVKDEEIAKMQAAMPTKPVVAPLQPRTMLVFNLSMGFKHSSIPYWVKALEIMAENTGAFAVVHSEDMAVFSPETLKRFDAICFNNTSGLQFDDAQKAALMEFVKGGKGIVGIHAATDNFKNWPEASHMMGGVFQGHPWISRGTWAVKLDDPEHPLMASFKGEGFKVNDEIYRTNLPFYSRNRQRVLMSLDMSDEATRTANGVTPEDMDTGISWIKPFGKGRVFYCSLGHTHHITWTTPILGHFLAGIQYALGDLKVDDTPLGEPAPALDETAANALIETIKGYDWGQSRAALTAFEQMIRDPAAQPDHLRVLEALVQPLLAAEMNRAVQDFACRQLSVLGTSMSVPALATLLDHPDTAHIARYALERIIDRSADLALLEKLNTVNDDATKIGMITSLGVRRYDGAVDAIGRIAAGSNAAAARAALGALGRIGSPNAAAVLIDVQRSSDAARRQAVLDALAECADAMAREGKTTEAIAIYDNLYAADNPSLIRVAALTGIAQTDAARLGRLLPAAVTSSDPVLQVAAIRLVAGVQSPAVLEAVVSRADQLAGLARVQMLAALADNGSPVGLKTATQAMDSADSGVRMAAYRAVGVLGGADSVMPLAQAAAGIDDRHEKDSARQALYQLKGDAVAATIERGIRRALEPSGDEAVAIELIRSIHERGIDSAHRVLFEAAQHSSGRVANEAIRVIQAVGRPDDMPRIAELLEKRPVPMVENTAVVVAEKIPDRNRRAAALLARFSALETQAAQSSFLRVMGRLGDIHAAPTLRRMRDSEDSAIRDAAFRAMADWPGADFVDQMRQVAEHGTDDVQRVLAFRAYVRMLPLEKDKSDADIVAALTAAMRNIGRPQEQRLVLSALGEYGTPDALQTALAAMDTPDLQTEAEVAVVRIAERLSAHDLKSAVAALETVRDKTTNTSLKEQAQTLLETIYGTIGFVTHWKTAGPYTDMDKPYADLLDTVFDPEKEGVEAAWQLLPPSNNPKRLWEMNFMPLFGGNHRVAYAKTTIRVPEAVDAVFEIGSDDGVKVWHNGQVVHVNNPVRPVVPASDKAPVRLRKGDNTILLKVSQAAGGWGFCFRIADAEGIPLRHLEIAQ